MSAKKIFLICMGGLLLNVLGSLFSQRFNLPIYLDTAGTIYIAALGGYVPGIAVGFFTNLIKAFFTPSEMYYCSVSVFIAIFAAFFSHKGFFKNYSKAFILVIPLALITTAFDLLLEDFLNSTNFFRSIQNFDLDFGRSFLYEFFDKGFSMFMAVILLKFSSPQVKEALHLLGKKQSPLPDEMKEALRKEKYLSSSLRTKTLAILMLSALFVSFSIALISYLLFKSAAIDERVRLVDSMDSVVLSYINPDHIDKYIKHGRAFEEYNAIERQLYTMKNTNNSIKFIYVYKVVEDGFQVIFDLNSNNIEGDKPGELIPFEKSIKPYIDDLILGRPIPPIITNDKYGHLLTLYKPLYDSNGKCQCYVAMDLSMDFINEYAHNFVIKLLALFIGCFVFIFAIGFSFVENNIILPVNSMAYCAKILTYENEATREKQIDLIKSLKIKTGDEIEHLYRSFQKTTENVVKYLKNLQKAKMKVADMHVKVAAMDKIAHKDSLTGIKNKTSYVETILMLDKKIADNCAKFCIIMVDVNYLKRVNDTYGHERGNEYLVNACRLTCSIFGEEHVYRIGGDEFVVIIEGDKVSLSKYFVKQFNAEMARKNANELLEPWEKVSAAIGVAYYEKDIDKTAEEVFKRADKEMYANKLAMKAARTD